MTNNNRLTFCALLACVALPAFGDVVYTDTTFATAAWLPPAFTYIHNDTGATNTSSVSYTTGPENCPSCGDGGAGGLTFTTTSVAFGTTGEVDAYLFTGYINSSFTWDPGTQGALLMVSGSMEVLDTNTDAPGEPDLDQFDILIEQGGNYYFTEAAVENNDGTFNLVTQAPITASSFFEFNPTTGASNSSLHPDFSSAGGVMEFGLFFAGGSVAPIPPFSETSTFSDLTLDLTPTTPEPAGLVLVGTALAGLAFLRRRQIR